MSADVAKIIEYIAALEAALADPSLSMEYEGHRVTFESADAIVRRIKYFKNKLQKLDPRTCGPRRTTVYTNSRKGL